VERLKLRREPVPSLHYTFLLPTAVLVVLVASSPAHLLYDEPLHLNLAWTIQAVGWRAVDPDHNPTMIGPLFAVLQLAMAPLTDLQAPAVRWINVLCLAGTVACLTAWLRHSTRASGMRACQLLAVPFLWPTVGMALTELPALCAFTVFGYLIGTVISNDGGQPEKVWMHAIAAGLGLGISILGRQTYLVVLPCLLAVALVSKKDARALVTTTAVAVGSVAWLLFLWRGPAPHSLDGILRWDHLLLSLSYFGIAGVFIAPWRTFVPSAKLGAYAIVFSLALTWAFFRNVGLPATGLMSPLVKRELTLFVGLGLRTLMMTVGLLWLWITIREGWMRRHEPAYLLITLMLLALLVTPARITHLFSSRYVVGGLGLLVMQLSPKNALGPADIGRLILGTLLGAGTLWSYYSQ
jgi:hypothetical protein